jgi:hypothetical protein
MRMPAYPSEMQENILSLAPIKENTMWNNQCDVSVLKGKVLKNVKVDDAEIHFETVDGERYKMYHEQDCCENVYVESVVGDVTDLLGEEVLVADEVSNQEYEDANEPEYAESYSWTFYKLATRRGYVDIRWFGSSNGYYGEGVHFCKVD